MCTGGGSFNPGMGPTQNLINPRQNINSNEYNLRRNILPDANGPDAQKAMNRSIDEENARRAAASAGVNSGSDLLEAAPDNRGTAVQRRKPRSLLSAAGGVGDTSAANVGASMAKAVLGG